MAFSLLCEYTSIYLSILPGLGLLQRGIFRHEAILKEEYVGVGQKWAVKSVILSLLFSIWFRLEISVFKDR